MEVLVVVAELMVKFLIVFVMSLWVVLMLAGVNIQTVVIQDFIIDFRVIVVIRANKETLLDIQKKDCQNSIFYYYWVYHQLDQKVLYYSIINLSLVIVVVVNQEPHLLLVILVNFDLNLENNMNLNHFEVEMFVNYH